MTDIHDHLPSSAAAVEPSIETLPKDDGFALGQWHWVKTEEGERLACIMQIGSNFVELHRPCLNGYGHHVHRVHYKEYHEVLRQEPGADAVIKGFISEYQARVAICLEQIKAVTARLGVSQSPSLDGPVEGGNNALIVMSGAPDIKQYEKALIKAKDIELPALFAQMKQDTTALNAWLSTETLPLRALIGQMDGTVEAINDRIFNISIYAGLTEEAERVREGAPASLHERLHVMQRRLYMDEECLAAYRTGGIVFSEIGQFDAWLSEAENFQRLLPFPRCIVAFKVRRHEKQRESDGSLRCAMLNIQLRLMDEKTALYVRNGEQLYRLITALDFGEMLFPDKVVYDPTEPMMFSKSSGRYSFMTCREWEDRRAEEKATERAEKAWEKANPDIHWMHNPHRTSSNFSSRSWAALNEDSLYFDEAMSALEGQFKKYNRIALIIQGLFDRSEILHPHPPVKSWTAEGFSSAIELVRDADHNLHHGDEPDIEAYIAECNSKITASSVLYGQDRYWQQKEYEKERDRVGYRNEHVFSGFRPEGNPGPGILAIAAEWRPRARTAVFSWYRERLRNPSSRWDPDGPIRAKVAVPVSELFNVSAYTPGDFKRFFQDARTRERYLKWGHMFMTAEEYHAGNLVPTTPAS